MKRAAVVFAFLLWGLWAASDVQATTWAARPDPAGYNGSTTATFTSTDIAGTGTLLVLGDDEVSNALPIGFTFNFYGIDYTEAYISSNGFITFTPGSDSGCCEGQDIPSVFGPNNLIAGYWTDLVPTSGGTIHYYTTADPPGSRLFIVQFLNIPLLGGPTTASFQIILQEGTNNIAIQFPAASTSNGLLVYVTGIESSDGTTGLQYNYGDYSISGLEILITPPDISITTHPADQTACSGSSVSFTAAASSTPLPALQWEVSTDSGASWSSLPGETATSLTFTANAPQNNNLYRAVFTNGARATSNAARLSVTTLAAGPATIPSGTVGTAYTPTQFTTAGGTGTVSYAISSGVLPAGMSFASNGLLSGTPAESGTFPITVTSTDAGGCSIGRGYTLSIGLNNSVTVPAANGAGDITLTTTSPGCWFSDVTTRTEAEVGSDTDFDYPFGLVAFTVHCAQADVTITFPGSVAGSPYRKFGPTTPGNNGTIMWYTFHSAAVGGNSVELHLADGQPGDDTAADGMIVDAGGPALPVAAASVTVPTMTEWGMILFALLAGAGAVRYLAGRHARTHE